jgi:hypothetical protein
MEALAGLSVAANVAQFVVYGLQSAKYLYKAYNQTSDFIRERSEVSAIIKSIHSSGDFLKAIPEVKGDPELGEILGQAKLLADEIVSRFEAVDRRASKPLGKARVAFHALRAKSDLCTAPQPAWGVARSGDSFIGDFIEVGPP